MGLLTSFTQPVGLGSFDYVETVDARLISTTAANPGANTSFLSVVRTGRSLTIGGISVQISNSADNIDVGIYRLVGSTYTLLASSGSTASPGTGVQRIALTAPYVLSAGVDYYLALASSSTGLTVSRAVIAAVNANAFNNKSLTKATNFPLANFTSPTVTATTYWLGAGA